MRRSTLYSPGRRKAAKTGALRSASCWPSSSPSCWPRAASWTTCRRNRRGASCAAAVKAMSARSALGSPRGRHARRVRSSRRTDLRHASLSEGARRCRSRTSSHSVHPPATHPFSSCCRKSTRAKCASSGDAAGGKTPPGGSGGDGDDGRVGTSSSSSSCSTPSGCSARNGLAALRSTRTHTKRWGFARHLATAFCNSRGQ